MWNRSGFVFVRIKLGEVGGSRGGATDEGHTGQCSVGEASWTVGLRPVFSHRVIKGNTLHHQA